MKKLILKFLRPYVLQIIAEQPQLIASKKWTMTATDPPEDDKPPRTGGGTV